MHCPRPLSLTQEYSTPSALSLKATSDSIAIPLDNDALQQEAVKEILEQGLALFNAQHMMRAPFLNKGRPVSYVLAI